ncbi:hydantoinase/oxoprolinase family protein [Streptomyces inhibens]|uniref:hydantoinase/oxoprolinase family protein n=1 Tax=Streptomyces inhibens TaxID=2293571 RepID=UPI001EE6AC47|nr:hydantoinase/oxoprolinase family protein [Streptomyces inhibens]UKY54761.1 hydantoinase/oxoprolinase family protein [Streptomyces inhibens]
MTFRVAMDIGGTFTDVVAYDEDRGTFHASKAPTTPGDLAEGVFSALSLEVDSPQHISFFVHGTTQGLNALLERKGAKVLLLTTAGMRDVLHIARGNRNDMFELHYRKPTPLVDRSTTVEAAGRLDWRGAEVEPLDEDAVRQAARKARAEGYDVVAVCFLFAHVNPEHELRSGAILAEELGESTMVVLSHQVAREWREYERTSTTVLEAYTGPVVRRYLSHIEERFAERGLTVPVQVMQSSGGIVNAAFARRSPLHTLLSGPVGGTMGAAAVAATLGRRNAVCVDMGGTSFDVSLVLDGRPDISSEGTADGFPVLMPLVNLHTIGAGGGSIAYSEAGGLRVGPESAGATPGPACYGRGGTQPTVTDANAVLGRVDPEWFAGGRMTLDVDAAGRAVGKLADELAMSATELADGICDVANAKMAQAIRTLTVEHGLEPREFTMLAFGGAGPLHAVAIARELGIGEVVIPRMPGAFSAWGMLGTDVRRDLSRQFFVSDAALDGAAMSGALAELAREALAELADQGVPAADCRVEHSVDMRYEGQDYTLPVPLSGSDEPLGEGFTAEIAERFAQLHEARYGHATPHAPVEFVTLRTTGLGGLSRIEPGPYPTEADPSRDASTRQVVFDGQVHETAILRREHLPSGHRLAGPAIVVEDTSTTVLPPGSSAVVDANGFLVITVGASA